MKKIIFFLIIISSLQSWTKADDIREFQIEGISLGESLLDQYNKDVLDNIEKYYYPNSKKIVGLYSEVLNKNLNNYDAIQFSVTPENYQIEAIAGINYEFQNKQKECYRKMEKIFDEILSLFPNSKTIKEKESPHNADPSGKSVGKVYKINLDNGAIRVSCTDWTKELGDKFGWLDVMNISISNEKMVDYLSSL